MSSPEICSADKSLQNVEIRPACRSCRYWLPYSEEDRDPELYDGGGYCLEPSPMKWEPEDRGAYPPWVNADAACRHYSAVGCPNSVAGADVQTDDCSGSVDPAATTMSAPNGDKDHNKTDSDPREGMMAPQKGNLNQGEALVRDSGLVKRVAVAAFGRAYGETANGRARTERAIEAVADAVEEAYHIGYFCNVGPWLRAQLSQDGDFLSRENSTIQENNSPDPTISEPNGVQVGKTDDCSQNRKTTAECEQLLADFAADYRKTHGLDGAHDPLLTRYRRYMEGR